MSDEQIITLYWERSESAIVETAAVYGKYCHKIAMNILANNESVRQRSVAAVSLTLYCQNWKNCCQTAAQAWSGKSKPQALRSP